MQTTTDQGSGHVTTCQPPRADSFCLDEDYRSEHNRTATSGGHTRIQPPPWLALLKGQINTSRAVVAVAAAG